MKKINVVLSTLMISLSLTVNLFASESWQEGMPAAVPATVVANPVEPLPSQRTTVVARRTLAYQKFISSAYVGKLDLSSIISDPQVTCLNLYQMTREDCFQLGLQTHDW